jgi:G3E family GTPase
MSSKNDQIPMILFTGFLGAGKTTALNALLSDSALAGKRVAVVVNEFGSLGVDGAVLRPGNYSCYEINKGSIFCICMKTDLMQVFMEIDKEVRPDMVIAEATGVAEPRDLGTILDIPTLAARFRVAVNLCLVDPQSFLDIRKTLNPVDIQVRDADIIAINKTDLVPEPMVDRVDVCLRDLNSTAEILRTSQGRVPVDKLLNADFQHEWNRAPRERPPEGIVSVGFESDRVMNRLAFYDRLDAWRPNILRAKGVVNFPDRRLFVESDGTRISSKPVDFARAVGTTKTAFVVIARGLDEAEIRKGLDGCEG